MTAISAAVTDPRARYALGVLGSLLGRSVRVASPGEQADVCHGKGDARVRIPYAEGDWDAPDPAVSSLDGVALLHPRGSRTGDLLFASYAVLSAPWERVDPADEVGCPIAREGWLARNGLLREPLVHWYAQLLADRLGLDVPKQPTFVVTHDVDDNFGHIFRRRETWTRMKRDLRAGKLSAARRAMGFVRGVVVRPSSDPNDCFDDWREWHARRGSRPTYFAASHGLFHVGADERDVAYDIRDVRVRETLNAAAQAGAEIGVHFSINARASAERLRAERAQLEEALGVPVRSSRHHWWALGLPQDVWALQAQAGIEVDCSLGFNDDVGYRRGIAAPFRPYDPRTRQEANVLALPTIAMDAAALGLDYPREELADLLRRTASIGGAFVLDWHVHSANQAALPGALELLDEVADDARNTGMRPATPLELTFA